MGVRFSIGSENEKISRLFFFIGIPFDNHGIYPVNGFVTAWVSFLSFSTGSTYSG